MMTITRHGTKRDDIARHALDDLHFDELTEIVAQTAVEPRYQQRILRRAQERHDRDAILSEANMPRHLYVISAILDDPGVSASILDRFIEKLRSHVYRQVEATR